MKEIIQEFSDGNLNKFAEGIVRLTELREAVKKVHTEMKRLRAEEKKIKEESSKIKRQVGC